MSVLTRDDAALHRADAACDVDRGGQHLGGELLLGQVRQEPLRVEEDGVRADRLDDRHAGLLQQAREVAHLSDVVGDGRLVGGLADPLRERLHVVTGHAAVVREALVDDDELARPARDVVVVGGEKAADRHEVILLRGEHRAVGERCDLVQDLVQRTRGLARARAPR